MEEENCKIVIDAIKECVRTNKTVGKNLVIGSGEWTPFNFLKCKGVTDLFRYKVGDITFNVNDLHYGYNRIVMVQPLSVEFSNMNISIRLVDQP